MDAADGWSNGNLTLALLDGTTLVANRTLPAVVAAPATTALVLALDRVLYKPGQAVALAVVALNATLRPALQGSEVTIVLQTPGKIKVLREQAVLDEYGSARFKMLLDTQAELGVWTVTAWAGNSTSRDATFTVDEFVLPRFSASLAVEQRFVSPQQPKLTGTLTAKYSYGKPVTGAQAVVSLLQHTRVTPWPMMMGGAAPGMMMMPPAAPIAVPQFRLLKLLQLGTFSGSADFSFDVAALGATFDPSELRIEVSLSFASLAAPRHALRAGHRDRVRVRRSRVSLHAGGRQAVLGGPACERRRHARVHQERQQQLARRVCSGSAGLARQLQRAHHGPLRASRPRHRLLGVVVVVAFIVVIVIV